jgi:hypothetical protein
VENSANAQASRVQVNHIPSLTQKNFSLSSLLYSYRIMQERFFVGLLLPYAKNALTYICFSYSQRPRQASYSFAESCINT